MSEQSAIEFSTRQKALVEARTALFRVLEAALGRSLLASARRWARAMRANSAPEDLCQVAWLSLMRSPRIFELGNLTDLLRYAIGIVYHRAVSDRGQPESLEASDLPSFQSDGDVQLHIQQWMRSLPHDAQRMVLLRLEGLTHREIAEALRIRPATARQRWCQLMQDAPPFERFRS